MNRDDVLRMARKAGMSVLLPEEHVAGIGGIYIATDDSCLQAMEHFAALVAAHEREVCAKVCDAIENNDNAYNAGAMDCRDAIRARGES
jgi:hypothetical protein